VGTGGENVGEKDGDSVIDLGMGGAGDSRKGLTEKVKRVQRGWGGVESDSIRADGTKVFEGEGGDSEKCQKAVRGVLLTQLFR